MTNPSHTFASPFLQLQATPDESTVVAAMPSGREKTLVTSETNPVTGGIEVRGGGGISLPSPTVSISPSGDTSGATDAAAIQNAVNALQEIGKGVLYLSAGLFYCNAAITVRGGDPVEFNGYQGGIDIVGSHILGTEVRFTSLKGFIYDVGTTPHGSNSATAQMSIRNLKIAGPGFGSSGSVGLDVSPQGNYQSTTNAFTVERVYFTQWENCCQFDDTTTLGFFDCRFTYYVKGIRLGYNHDNMRVIGCRFGENNTIIGSQTEIAVAYDFISPRFSGATTLSGAQVHVYQNNWFMRQALVLDIWDASASNVVFSENYVESSKHYIQIGNAGLTQAPSRVQVEQNLFAKTDGQEQTQAMIKFMNSSAFGSLYVKNNTCDTATGPKAGWIEIGAGTQIEYVNNGFPVGGAYVTVPYHIIKGSKQITVATGDSYVFSAAGATDVRQFNASGVDGIPNQVTWAYNATDETIFQRWGTKPASSETANPDNFDIIQQAVSGTRYAMSSGFHKSKQGSATPTAGSQLRGCLFLVQGGAGVADTLFICAKNAADAYVWKSVALT